jgi:hypothetical protein
MRGRPQLFSSGRQISVLVSVEDYRSLAALVERAQIEMPGFSFGDLVRGYIRRCLATEPRQYRSRTVDPREDTVRHLYAIARTAQRIARELGHKAKPPKSAA